MLRSSEGGLVIQDLDSELAGLPPCASYLTLGRFISLYVSLSSSIPLVGVWRDGWKRKESEAIVRRSFDQPVPNTMSAHNGHSINR